MIETTPEVGRSGLTREQAISLVKRSKELGYFKEVNRFNFYYYLLKRKIINSLIRGLELVLKLQN
jgi:hypothetical protein